MRKYRVIVQGPEARKRLKAGVDAVANIVKCTLGPRGRNVVIGLSEWKDPLVTNDGVSVARHVVLKDPIENLGAKLAMESAKRTNDMAGDGTTTSTTLTQAIVNKVFETLDVPLVGSSENVMAISKKIKEECVKVIEALKEMSVTVDTLEKLERVAIAAVEDENLGRAIAAVVWTVGKDGFVDVDERFGWDVASVTTEIVDGMKFLGTYAAGFMITNLEKHETVVENLPILITNHEIAVGNIQGRADGKSFIDDVIKTGAKGIVIFAPKFDLVALKAFYGLAEVKGFKVFGFKIPSLTEEEMKDVATYVGATLIDKTNGEELRDSTPEKMGRAEKIVVNRDDVVVVGGAGDKAKVQERIEVLKKQIEVEKTETFKKKLRRRIASLSTGVAKIYVGAKTEQEKGYLKYKIEDAKNACKGALEEGIVPGGGLALKAIGEKLELDALKGILDVPYKQIQENAGGNFEIDPKVIDPTKVVRLAFENACSCAATIVTAEAALEEADDSLEALREMLILDGPEPKSIVEQDDPNDMKIF